MDQPTIDGYADFEEIGEGGFATVYRARQLRFRRTVAVKVLKAAPMDERANDRFERECQALGELSWHPHVVALYDSGVTSDGRPWLSMQYLGSGSLGGQIVRDGPLPWPEALIVGIQVSGALDAAHSAGTLHRDLKPENLLIGPYGETRLGDFGIAALEDSAHTATGHASFTVGHVAPEQLRGQRADERSDLYSLASTLFTLMAGRTPFAGDGSEPPAVVLARVLEAEPPRLSGVPDDVAEFIHGAMAKDPAQRPQSAVEFGQALQRLQAAHGETVTELLTSLPSTGASKAPSSDLGEETIVPPMPVDQDATIDHRAAPQPSAPGAAPAPPPETPPPAPLPDSAGSPSGGRRRLVVGTAVAVVALLAVIAAAVLLSGGSDTPEESLGGQSVATTSPIVDREDSGTDADASTEAGPVPTVTVPSEPLPDNGLVAEAVPTGSGSVGVAATTDAVWVTRELSEGLIRLDPATNEVAAQIDVGKQPTVVAATASAAWVSNEGDGTVSRIDPATNTVSATITVGSPAGTGLSGVSPDGLFDQGIAAADDGIWVANITDRTVVRIDPESSEVEATIQLEGVPAAVAVSESDIWVTTTVGGDTADDRTDDSGSLVRIDRETDEITATLDTGEQIPHAVAVSDDAVWVAVPFDNLLLRVDPTDATLEQTIALDGFPRQLSTTGDELWVAAMAGSDPTSHVIVVDTATGVPGSRITIPGIAGTMSISADAAWITDQVDATMRIDL